MPASARNWGRAMRRSGDRWKRSDYRKAILALLAVVAALVVALVLVGRYAWGVISARDDVGTGVAAPAEGAGSGEEGAGPNPSPSQPSSVPSFESWNEGARSLEVLTSFVEAATDEGSDGFIPVGDRIAVFDFDGTLYGELAPTYLEFLVYLHRVRDDVGYAPTSEQLAVADDIDEVIEDDAYLPDLGARHADAAAQAYAGMTIPEFHDFVAEFARTPVRGFDNVTYAEFFYQPMVEVVRYLQANEFGVYIVTGSDRYLVRAITDGVLELDDGGVIGMDVTMVATGQGDTDSLDYTYGADDELVRGDRLLSRNLRMGKVSLIAQEIGQQPVLAFGNGNGDVSMLNYVLDDNLYPSAAFMVLADDDVRDYANAGSAAALAAQWREGGYTVISMKDDFATIYPEGAVRQ